MSGFGAALIGGANCGTANPIAAMGAQMSGMGSQLSDVRNFGGVDKLDQQRRTSLIQNDSMMRPPSMQQQQANESSSSHFASPMMPMPLHHPAMQAQMQQQRQMQQMRQMQQQQQSSASGMDMADQFAQMEMQFKQQQEMERAFHQANIGGGGGGGADGWSAEFHQQQRSMPQRSMPQQQQQAAMMYRQQQMQQGRSSDYMMQQRMMGMGMGMSGMNMGMNPMSMMGNMSHMMPQSSSSSSAARVTELPDDAVAGVSELDAELAEAEADGDDADALDDAYGTATSNLGADWADQFAAQESARNASLSSNSSGMGGGMDKDMINQLMNSDNPKWRNSKFLKFIDKISKGEIEFRDNQAFERTPAAAQAAAALAAQSVIDAEVTNAVGQEWSDEYSASQSHPASWGDEFGASSVGAEVGDQHMAGESKSQAERWLEDYQASGEADTEFKDFDWQQALSAAKESMPARADPSYQFAAANPYLDTAADSFALGQQLFEQGKLKEAILAFEAVVQKQSDHADAWACLGEAQAQNEHESNAIAAFLSAVAIDPYNLKSLLQLGVSYTNDLEEHRALNYLKTWMKHNPDYAAINQSQQTKQESEYAQMYGGDAAPSQYSYDHELHGEVARMFRAAAEMRPQDADVHTVLGVLFHISSDFDQSIASFQSSIALRPEDAPLWNKLGATLANSSRSNEAVHAYQRALSLRPSYVRALANLAISYANQGMHEEATRTYLTTLHFNSELTHVWSYLRISLSHLGRQELVELSQAKNVELFRPHFTF